MTFKMWRQALIPANHKALNRITEKKTKIILSETWPKQAAAGQSKLFANWYLKNNNHITRFQNISQAPHSAALELLCDLVHLV